MYDDTREGRMRWRLQNAIAEEAQMREDINELVALREALQYGTAKKAGEILEKERGKPSPRMRVQHLLALLKLVITNTSALRELRGLQWERMSEVIGLQAELPDLPANERVSYVMKVEKFLKGQASQGAERKS